MNSSASAASPRLEVALRWGIVALSLVGLYIAGVLTYAHASGRSVPCGAEGQCDLVLQDRWATVLDVPLALWGVGFYAALLGIATMRLISPRWNARRLYAVGLGLSASGALAGITLTLHSILHLKGYCAWCLASAVDLCLTFSVYACSTPSADWPTKRGRDLAAIGAAALYIGGGVWLTGTMATSPRTGLDLTALSRLKDEDLAPSGAQSLGSSNASTALVVFFDPKCPACADVDDFLRDVPRRKPDVRVVFRYMPWSTHKESKAMCALLAAYLEKGSLARAIKSVCELGSAGSVGSLAESLGIDPRTVARLQDPADPAWQRVQSDLALAGSLNVTQTPTIIEVSHGRHRSLDVANAKLKYL